ncbi:MAG: chorismate synthase [Bacteroides sp. SM23_62_1]|nr:MAG: chorismate synthase [Bacteroides sp. SM23_62_1]
MNSFGRILRTTILGESHGPAVSIILDGCPAGIPLDIEDFSEDFNRRKSGIPGTTPRTEPDVPEIISGVFKGFTTGTPIGILIKNEDTRSSDYSGVTEVPRPGHADFVALKKYGGFADFRGGGHFSGRLTTGLVAAGVIAKKIIKPVHCQANLIEAGGSTDINAAVNLAIEENDSIGGIVECRIMNVPVGLGEPFFDSVESVMSHLAFSIPAVKGIEFGSGFKAARMRGSEHNDPLISADGKTKTNHAGGINGGISNGNEILFRVAVKPTSSTPRTQKTINLRTGKMVDLAIEGRHDTCIALRVPVVLEACSALVIADFMLLEQQIDKIQN